MFNLVHFIEHHFICISLDGKNDLMRLSWSASLEIYEIYQIWEEYSIRWYHDTLSLFRPISNKRIAHELVLWDHPLISSLWDPQMWNPHILCKRGLRRLSYMILFFISNLFWWIDDKQMLNIELSKPNQVFVRP